MTGLFSSVLPVEHKAYHRPVCINKQLPCYISYKYKPDAEAYATDAFSVSFKEFHFYAILPFSLIPRVLQTIRMDRFSGVLIVYAWKTQVWWPMLLRMTTGNPIPLESSSRLTLPSHPDRQHLLSHLQLRACRMSSHDIRKQGSPRTRQT